MSILPEIDRFYKDLGERIKTERIKKKISQEKLAELMNLTRSSVVNFERGRHRPSVYQVVQLGNFLSVDFTELIPFVFQKDSVPIPDIDIETAVTDQAMNNSAKNSVREFISTISKD